MEWILVVAWLIMLFTVAAVSYSSDQLEQRVKVDKANLGEYLATNTGIVIKQMEKINEIIEKSGIDVEPIKDTDIV
ncbi:MAG: hypothetical protein ACTSU6_04790 [Candidatus Njordarchaeales archaeon]